MSGYALRRAKRGVRRIERSDSWYGGWIARGVDGYRLPWGDDFEWSTRSAAWHVCLEDDLFNGPEKRAAANAAPSPVSPNGEVSHG